MNLTSLMLQTWSRNSISIHARHEPMTNPWYFSYDDYLMSRIYLHLACYLTLVGTWMNLILWDCNSLTSWAISTSPRLYTMVVEDKEARNHSNISFDKFYVKLHDCHFWIHKCSSLQKLTHVGRWTQIPSGAPNSWWATSTLSNPHKFNYMINTTNHGMLFHLREALPQDMGQSSSTRCEYIKYLNEKW